MARLLVDGNQTLGVQLTERHMQRPLVFTQMAQAIQREIDALADTHSGSANEAQRVRGQVVGVAQFLIQELVVFRRKWCGQTAWQWREILAANEVGLDGIAVLSQVLEEAAE